MASFVFVLLGLAELYIGGWLLMRSRTSRSDLAILAGAFFVVVGIGLIANGLWAAGRLVGSDG